MGSQLAPVRNIQPSLLQQNLREVNRPMMEQLRLVVSPITPVFKQMDTFPITKIGHVSIGQVRCFSPMPGQQQFGTKICEHVTGDCGVKLSTNPYQLVQVFEREVLEDMFQHVIVKVADIQRFVAHFWDIWW